MEIFHSYRNEMSSPFLGECKGVIPFLILYLQYSKANSSEDDVKHVIRAACESQTKSETFFAYGLYGRGGKKPTKRHWSSFLRS